MFGGIPLGGLRYTKLDPAAIHRLDRLGAHRSFRRLGHAVQGAAHRPGIVIHKALGRPGFCPNGTDFAVLRALLRPASLSRAVDMYNIDMDDGFFDRPSKTVDVVGKKGVVDTSVVDIVGAMVANVVCTTIASAVGIMVADVIGTTVAGVIGITATARTAAIDLRQWERALIRILITTGVRRTRKRVALSSGNRFAGLVIVNLVTISATSIIRKRSLFSVAPGRQSASTPVVGRVSSGSVVRGECIIAWLGT